MNKEEYIEIAYDRYLKKYQGQLAYELVQSIRNIHEKFEPYNSNPIHYILSIYDPLQLYYTLLGANNLSINLEFEHENEIDEEIIHRLELDKNNPDSKYNPEVIQLKRVIEYHFLDKVLKEVERELSRRIQLYITQHITEISYDISTMKKIDAAYLWENLEK